MRQFVRNAVAGLRRARNVIAFRCLAPLTLRTPLAPSSYESETRRAYRTPNKSREKRPKTLAMRAALALWNRRRQAYIQSVRIIYVYAAQKRARGQPERDDGRGQARS